jgi:N-acetylmuramoyl-L-alanine amidase
MRDLRDVSLIVVHHSATHPDTPMEQIDKFHRERGWRGIGYHHYIEGDGKLRMGRPVEENGAHARGYNTVSLGVCLAGDNTRTDMDYGWREVQIKQLVALIRSVRMVFGDLEIQGHRDLPKCQTLCPGLDVRELLRERGVDPGGDTWAS